MTKQYAIGIDLGTTNSAVSYVDLSEPKPNIRLFKVPQLIGAGEFSALPILPSFLYIPGEYDISKDAIMVPWNRKTDNFVGIFARDHGAKVPARLVSSAKSWLCHSNVDRHARILPWGSGDDVYKVSPVQASASYLSHIKSAWNREHGDDEDLYMENQMVILTVPASFDEVARELTLESANVAGLKNVVLLEEPLAAFYSWLIRHEHHWQELIKPDELIMVCDVGGGTTDFTLITLKEAEGSPRFERIAVGDHLILGGDNIDLALARRIEMRFSQKKASLSPDRWRMLCHQCRQAKEMILNGEVETKKITLMGTGTRLIADTLSANLDRNEVEETVLEGFFQIPDTVGTSPQSVPRKGITEFGLPYEQEPSVTKHLGLFLERHKDNVCRMLNRTRVAPDLILFNGGSLKSTKIQERIRAAIRKLFSIEDEGSPRILENPEPDLAVALGASYYGLVKLGQGVRVGSGSPRSYYLGIQTQDAEAPKTAICLVERGLDEGSHIELKDRQFEVLTNQPVLFDVYSSSFRSGDRCGDLIPVDDSLTPLPPIKTVIQYGKKGVRTQLPVTIEAGYTEVGTLSLWCLSKVSPHRWQLQFQLRDTPEPGTVADEEIFDEELVASIRQTVRKAFSNPQDKRAIQTLTKDISAIIERPKEKWSLGLIRCIADELIEIMPQRTLTSEWESRWLNLTGFCLRPGFGDGFDEHRIKNLWKIYPQGPVFLKNPQVRAEWWILWRRVAGGLNSGQQRQISQELTAIMTGKKAGKIHPHEHLEMWMAIANLERIIVKDKIKWGRQLLAEILNKKNVTQYFWSLSRIGARELLYGSADRVILPDEVWEWIRTLIENSWQQPKSVISAVAQMARKTGDRVRDLEAHPIKQIMEWMTSHDATEPHIRVLKDVVPMEKQEQSTIFGESLPSGLVLNS